MRKVLAYIMLVLVIGSGSYLIYSMNTKKDNNENNNGTKQESKVLTKEEAEELGNKLWTYAYDTFWCKNFEYGEEKIVDDIYYWYEVTNFYDVKSHFTDDFEFTFLSGEDTLTWDDLFEDYMVDDGKVYDQTMCARGGDIEYNKTVLSVDKIEENMITYDAVSSYCRELDMDNEEFCNDSNVTESFTNKFVIKKVSDNFRIYKFVFPN